VVPIPYYDRNPDRTFGEYHYEGKLFPADVPITHYEDYNFAERMPDAIFIHNPYDLGNLVTSVEPKFYSNILKNYTNLLIYIPYFLFPKEPQTHLIDTFALENVDSIFVQNEEVKEAYVNQAKIVGNEKVLEKVFAVGSPKIDKICEICKDGIPVPDIWKEMSANKKKVFMNTNVSLILNNKDKFIEAFEKSPASVKALLVGDNTGGTTVTGIMQEVQEKLKPALDAKGGYFTARSESLSSQISNLSDKIDKKQEYVYTYQERLTKQFNYMDQMIAQMNAQFSQMQQQLASIGVEVG